MHINDPRATFGVVKKNGAKRRDKVNPRYPHAFTQAQNMSKSTHNQAWDSIRKKQKTFPLVNSIETTSKGNIFESAPDIVHLNENSTEINNRYRNKIDTISERKFQKRNVSQVLYSNSNCYPDYENTEAQEEAIYQNLVFVNGKSFPETKRCHENLELNATLRCR